MNVTVAGGRGSIATLIVNGLLKSITTTFHITILTRKKPPPAETTSSSSLHTLRYVEVDYTNHTHLVAALRGTAVLISAVNQIPTCHVDDLLLDAALAANVPRFFPYDYDCDNSHPHVKATAEVVYADRYRFMNRLERVAEEGRISWTVLSPSEFLADETALEWLGFDVARREARLYDGGKGEVTGCSVEFAGDCYAAAVDQERGMKNKRVPIAEVRYTGLEVLRILEEVMQVKWTVVEDVSSRESMCRAEEAMRAGDVRKAFLVHVLRLNYDGVGPANLVEGLEFMKGKISRRSLREVIECAVEKSLEQIQGQASEMSVSGA